jgi:hypothetical protein
MDFEMTINEHADLDPLTAMLSVSKQATAK